jgi:hypothetical protein
MSYRNPQQVVDTQSGQHIQNMLKQITGATTGAIKTIQANYKQREKENVERVQKLNSAQGKFLNAYNAADIKNSATDWQTPLEEALIRHGELVKKQLNDPLNFTTDNAKELSWLQTIPNQILEDAKQTEAKMQSYNDTMEIPPGDFDGIDKFAPPKLYKTLDVEGQVGSTAGRSIGNMRWDSNLSRGYTEVVSYDGEGNEIGTDANRAFDLPVVPNPTKNIKEVGNGIKETKVNYYKEGVKTRRVSIKDSKGKETGGYNQEYQEVDMDRLIADVRKKSDSYIIGIGAQPASRLSNNKMLEYIDEIPTMPGMPGVGDLGKIIDPDKATWDMDATGKVIDPYLERTQIAYAKMLIKEEGLGVEKPLRKVYDKTGDEKTIPEDYSNIIESWDSNIADDKPENFVNQDISINGSKKASIDPESNELTLSYKSGANDNTKRKTYKLDDNNIHILYKALAGGYNTSFSKSIIAKALKTRKNIKKDSSQITSENTVLDPSNVGVMTEEQQKEARIKKLP